MIRTLLLPLLLSAAHAPAIAAFSCTLIGKPGTAIALNGSRKAVPAGLDDCEGVRVVAGSATACFIDATGRRICRPYARGKVITRTSLVETRNIGGGFLAVLQLLMGDGTSASAVSRGDAAPELPHGPVLLLTPSLRVRLALSRNAAIDFHEGAPDGPLVAHFENLAPATLLRVPGLTREKSYYWVLRTDGPAPPPTRFTVASAQESKTARMALAQIDSDKAAGALGRTVLKADWLLRHGYAFDAAQQLRGAGLELAR